MQDKDVMTLRFISVRSQLKNTKDLLENAYKQIEVLKEKNSNMQKYTTQARLLKAKAELELAQFRNKFPFLQED